MSKPLTRSMAEQTTRFVIVADLSRATAPAPIILRKLLKIIGRVYKTRCLRCSVTPLPGAVEREAEQGDRA